MTPEEAIALEPGTTPGPWYAFRSDDPDDDMYEVLGTNPHRPNTHPILVDLILGPDAFLIAAAPDMRSYIAAQTWEYRVIITREGRPTIVGEWTDEESAREDYQFAKARRGRDVYLVRRPVGPVEVAE